MSDKYIKNLTNNVCYNSYDPNECQYQVTKSASNVKKMYEKFNNTNNEFNYVQNELDETLIQSSLVNKQSEELMNKRYNSVQEIEKMTNSTNMKKSILKNRINSLAKKEINIRGELENNLDNLEIAKYNFENIIENFSINHNTQPPQGSQNIPQEPSLTAEPVNLVGVNQGDPGMDSQLSQDLEVEENSDPQEPTIDSEEPPMDSEDPTMYSEEQEPTMDSEEEIVDDSDMAQQSNNLGIEKPIINENNSGGCSSYTVKTNCESNTDAENCFWWGNMCNNKPPSTEEDARQINNENECTSYNFHWSSVNGPSSCLLKNPNDQ